jgi:hypothetical protein
MQSVASKFDDHPTVKAMRAREPAARRSEPLDAAWLRGLCLEAGADDVGFVDLDRPALEQAREHILRAFPRTQSLISFV